MSLGRSDQAKGISLEMKREYYKKDAVLFKGKNKGKKEKRVFWPKGLEKKGSLYMDWVCVCVCFMRVNWKETERGG